MASHSRQEPGGIRIATAIAVDVPTRSIAVTVVGLRLMALPRLHLNLLPGLKIEPCPSYENVGLSVLVGTSHRLPGPTVRDGTACPAIVPSPAGWPWVYAPSHPQADGHRPIAVTM